MLPLQYPASEPPPGFVRTPDELMDAVLRGPLESGGCGRHELDADAFVAAERHPAGGVLPCVLCGQAVFVPPATCLERVEDDLDEIDGGIHPRA